MPAVSRRRPSRAALEGAIRSSAGNLSRTAASLGCSRSSLYVWVYQLGLADVVGIRQSLEERMAKPKESGLVSASVKLPEELWKRARHRAIDEDRTTSDVIAEALRRYLEGGRS